MKRSLLFLFIMFIALAVYSQSQSPNALARQLKQRVKDKMKFTDPQTDSVMMAQVAFFRSWRQARNDDALSEDQKKAQLKALKAERDARIQSALHLPKGRLKKLLSILPDQLMQ